MCIGLEEQVVQAQRLWQFLFVTGVKKYSYRYSKADQENNPGSKGTFV